MCIVINFSERYISINVLNAKRSFYYKGTKTPKIYEFVLSQMRIVKPDRNLKTVLIKKVSQKMHFGEKCQF